MFRRHPILAPLTLAYLALVAWITLGPQPLDHQRQDWVLVLLHDARAFTAPHWPRLAAQLTYDHAEFLANVAMFAPIGLFLVLLLGRRFWWAAVLLCVAMTGFIETAQRFIPGRVSDVRDIVSNSVGGLVGVIVALIVTIPAYRRERDRHRIRELEAELTRYRNVA
ncbi:VanZ family protein [Gryllotalpicola koreensis]|uniref:VanZ-like domain-containing protein n=1 Tax=Gryllotalpicola koreensis TaxID=993086 RepID=A0ABP8AB94_9MICO